MIAAYPLQWPEGWRRLEERYRKRANFGRRERSPQAAYAMLRDLTVADGATRCLSELAAMGVEAQDVVISTNVRTRLDGLPRSGEPEPKDPGAAVYWEDRGSGARRVMAVDRYDRVADNLAAIAATLEAMRAIERHGGAQILERAFTGFDALPNPAKRGWREILGIPANRAIPTEAEIDYAYRAAAMVAHPDRGGSDARMAEINAARDAAMRELRQ